MKNFIAIALVVVLFSACNRNADHKEVTDTRTSGTATILVDESFSRILDDQFQVFKSDYPNTTINTIVGNEKEILPKFLNGDVRLIIMSRMLKPAEEAFYRHNKMYINTDRFAVDGIALITNAANLDTTITVDDVYGLMRGLPYKGKKLVFDHPASSTVRYFMDSAKVDKLPESGVYTLKTNNDVIKYVAEHKDFIGVVGINWILQTNNVVLPSLSQIKVMGVKNSTGKEGSEEFYKPEQKNLINGRYPFLRNIYIINCESRDGLGTGFANWLCSQRGQLIVLKSGLGPHKILPREFNYKKN